MGLRADAKYRGTITQAEWIESQGGTSGLQVDVQTPDGTITHVWWLTPKTKEYFEKAMKGFGITVEELKSGTFVQYELPTMLQGREVSLGTKEEIYKEKARVKVAWIGAHNGVSDERGIGYAVSKLFGGTEQPKAPRPSLDNQGGEGALPLEDGDIPF